MQRRGLKNALKLEKVHERGRIQKHIVCDEAFAANKNATIFDKLYLIYFLYLRDYLVVRILVLRY